MAVMATGNSVPKLLYVSSVVPEVLQNLQMRIREKLQMLKMLQLLQLQLGDSCNCNGLRNSRMIGCKGAAARNAGRPEGRPYPAVDTG
jgi:hypothetical protein